jgi:Mg2+/Co2+ transporter CorC
MKIIKTVPHDIVPILELQRSQIHNLEELRDLILKRKSQADAGVDAKKELENLNEQFGSPLSEEELNL